MGHKADLPECPLFGRYRAQGGREQVEPSSDLCHPWGVYDRLSQLGCPNLVGVNFGARADRTDASDAAARYANKRAEM